VSRQTMHGWLAAMRRAGWKRLGIGRIGRSRVRIRRCSWLVSRLRRGG
jgi:hypothetical protein